MRVFDGDMDDYARLVLSKSRGEEPKRAPVSPAQEGSKQEAPKRRDAGQARRKLAAAEERVEKFAQLLARVDEALAAPDAFARNPQEAARLGVAT